MARVITYQPVTTDTHVFLRLVPVEFAVDKVTLGQIFFKYFGFPLYHATCAPYSFIYLSPVLYNLSTDIIVQ